jgi:P4 family phage/plasmid primase-like protien
MSGSHEPHTDYNIERGVFPADLLTVERWFVWAMTDDDRKIPRAPWEHPGHIDRYVSAMDESVWTDFGEADEWASKVSRFGHASCVPAYEDNTEPRLILFDFDDCRDPETEAIHGQAWAFIEKYDLSAFISTSGTGLHGFAYGTIPEGYKPSFDTKLPDWEYTEDPELEVYGSARFCALTGEHIESTRVNAPRLDELLADLYRSKGTERTTGTEREPDLSREEVADVDSTTDIEDIYDAIRLVRPRDIRLKSTKTQEYNRGRDEPNCALDPSWANSESGTRLAQFDDHWLYRKGNYNLDALQVVALEERIIRDEGQYPEGEDFVDAVDKLRDRGADIPELESTSAEFDVVSEDSDDSSPEQQPDPEPSSDARGETDGGVAVESASGGSEDIPTTPFEKFKQATQNAISEWRDDDEATKRTARHRIAQAMVDNYHFVYPEEEVRGWRTTLYAYHEPSGVYEPRGEHVVEKLLERAAGDFVSNQVISEVKAKVRRKSIERGEVFEVNPEKLVVENGILDLHTGELEPHSPAEYHRQRIDVKWNPDAGEPTAVDDFLHEIVADADVTTMYRLIAHTLYKEYLSEKAAILIGNGENGKSVFLNLIEEFIGPHNVVHRELQDFDEDGFSANNLEGKLANLATEIGEQELDDTTTFKKLTGRDTIDARVKYESPVTFENFATLMFATNEMPVFDQDNHAIWRRWVYVDFPYSFDPTDPAAKDPIPKSRLMKRLTSADQLEALLVRCQQEIQRWHENDVGFFSDSMQPDEVREKMKKAAEPIFNFTSACLRPSDDDDEYTKKETVRAAYRAYANEEDLPSIPESEFGRRLLAKSDVRVEPGRHRIDGTPTQTYDGVVLSSRGRQVLDLDGDTEAGQASVDDIEQATGLVMEELREMVDENDGQPVSRDGLIWRAASGDMGKVTAENAVDKLKTDGRVLDGSDGILPTE